MAILYSCYGKTYVISEGKISNYEDYEDFDLEEKKRPKISLVTIGEKVKIERMREMNHFFTDLLTFMIIIWILTLILLVLSCQ